jgi:hypothetical protein
MRLFCEKKGDLNLFPEDKGRGILDSLPVSEDVRSGPEGSQRGVRGSLCPSGGYQPSLAV